MTESESIRTELRQWQDIAEAAQTAFNHVSAENATLLAHRAVLREKVLDLAAFNDRGQHSVECDAANEDEPCECRPSELIEGYVQDLLDILDAALASGEGRTQEKETKT